ncbi:MAG TPA: hypothetical protein VJ464_19540 [Blastocatellia bacterium]|nr:hypothetical protein [Blastocatellia bacterium]
MTSQDRAFVYLLIAIIFLYPLRVRAMLPIQDSLLTVNAVLIRNVTDKQVTFWLSNGGSKWVNFQLDGGDHDIYYNTDRIWIGTAGRPPVEYRLELKHRYQLEWDSEKGIWDVKEQRLEH